MPLPPDEAQQFFARELNLPKLSNYTDRIQVDPVSREVRVLNIDNLDLKTLDLSFIERYPGIECLNLNRNLLKQLNLIPLQNCRKLRVLDLGCNDFSGFLLDLTPLEKCPCLERINLAGDMTLASAEPNISQVKLPQTPHLTIIDMHMNALKEVDLSPLAQSHSLEELDLSWNHLERVNHNQLKGCTNLKNLLLNNNLLQTFPPEACIPSLKILTLGFNKLTRIPSEVGSLACLETLDVSFNPLTVLPSSLAKLRNLRVLNLAKLGIAEAPTIGENCRHLQKLNLHNTSKALLTNALNQYPSLESLDLSSNSLGEIPEIVQSYVRLTELNLRFNKITSFPPWFGDLTQLESLDLAANPLETIPASIFTLKRLHSLSIREVPLTTLPRQLLDLPALKTLFIPEKVLKESVTKELVDRGVHVSTRGMFN